MALEAARRAGPRRLVVGVVVALAVLAVGVAAAIVVSSPSSDVERIDLADVDEGVSLHRIGDRAAILVRTGNRVRAFSQVDARSDRVIWCPKAARFSTVRGGTQYDVTGAKLGGPSPADLTELGVRRVDDTIQISTTQGWGDPIARWSDRLPAQWTGARPATCLNG